MSSGKNGRRVVWTGGLALLAWLTGGLFLAPYLIRQGYEERGFDRINDIFRGRDVHPVEHYLQGWQSLFLKATVALVCVAVVVYLAIRFRRALMPPLRRFVRGNTCATLSGWDFLILAAFFGFIGGYVEAAGAVVKAVLKGMPHYGVGYSAEVVWMSPLANALLYVATAGILLIVTLLWRRSIPLRGTVVLFVTAAAYIASRSLRIGLHPAAVLLLGLGVAIQVANWAERNNASFRRAFTRGTAALVLAVLVTAGAMAWYNRPGDPSVAAGEARRNVILVILDTVRSRNLSLYGHSRPTTPFLERLAGEALVFDHAVSTSSWTLPSHSSMFTGRYPYELGADWEARLDDRAPTLAEVLSDNGYRTGGFVANTTFAGGRTGLNRGFQYYDDQPINLPMLISNSWMARRLASKLTGEMEMPFGTWGRKHADEVNAGFLDWVDNSNGRPFFAFLNYFDAHHPYHVHEPFSERFSGPLPPARVAWDNHYSIRELENFKLGYDNAIAYLDAQLDTLFGQLQRRGLLDNTVVIITSDHGEQLGEQNQDAYGHGNSVYASSIEVPLLVYAPAAAVRAGRVEQTVSLRDLPATVMRLLDLQQTSPFPGVSLLGLASDSVGTPRETSAALAELSLDRGFGTMVPSWQGHTRSITSGDLHYIANGDGTEELYDRTRDAWELHNLAAERAQSERMKELRDLLAAIPDASHDLATTQPGH